MILLMARPELKASGFLCGLWPALQREREDTYGHMVLLLSLWGSSPFGPNSQASQGSKELLHLPLQQPVPLLCILTCPL